MNDIQNTQVNKTQNSSGFDINAIIEQQGKEVGMIQEPATDNQPTSQVTTDVPFVEETKENKLQTSVSGLSETSFISTEEKKTPNQGFNLGAILSEVPQNTNTTDLSSETKVSSSIKSVTMPVVAKVFGLIFIAFGLAYGTYFAAKIFYPIETENATNTISAIMSNLSANILGGDNSNQTGSDSELIPTTDKVIVEDNIKTPIADSIQNNQGFSEGNGSIANTSQVQQNWDTILPENSNNQGETSNIEITSNTVLPETTLQIELPTTENTDKSLNDLGEAFGMDTSTVDKYIEQLTTIQNDVKERQYNYENINNQRGITITKTINTRIDQLIEALQNTSENNAETSIMTTIEADIVQLNQLLAALNQ